MSGPETMTYASLVTDIEAYAERSVDTVFVAQVPRFIMMAENRIASEKKPLGLQRNATGAFSGSSLPKPMRWRYTRSISYLNGSNQRVFLKSRSYEWCRSYSPDASVSGAPLYYADYDYEYFFFSPAPSSAFTFELLYYERPEPLSSSNQTNWTTQYAPQLLLYASLIEAMPFLKNSERIPEFKGLYDLALAAVIGEDAQRLVDNSVVRSK